MKVYCLPADAYGCGHYRLIWPADVLKRMGFDVVILPPRQRSGCLAKFKENEQGQEQLESIQVPEGADVIVLQRPGHPLQPQMINIMRANGIAVVIDMDDDMSAIHPHNVAFHMYRHHSGTPFSWRWATESCKRATLVTTSTAALQKVYAPHGRGIVLDNYIPAAYLNFDKPHTGAFGWAGNIGSHPNDLQVTAPAVPRLIEEGCRFIQVGDPKGVKAALRLKQDHESTGGTSLAEYTRTICHTFDVGMIPLAATSFNTSKSRLKGIEMSAVGIPWVASPRAEYRRLVRESAGGLLADTPKDWYTKLKTLITDEVLRKELADAGKAYMKDQTYEQQAWRWADAWATALTMERGHATRT